MDRDQDAVVRRAIENIQARRAAQVKKRETNTEQTKRLFRWNGRDKWEYRGDFVRGKNTLWSGLPHFYESTVPAYIMSRAGLRQYGFKPGNARPIAYTHNVKASVYAVYDIRDCVAIGGAAAKNRRKDSLDRIREINQAQSWRRGWDILLSVLEGVVND